jgi:hypothetical protein
VDRHLSPYFCANQRPAVYIAYQMSPKAFTQQFIDQSYDYDHTRPIALVTGHLNARLVVVLVVDSLRWPVTKVIRLDIPLQKSVPRCCYRWERWRIITDRAR